MGRKSLKDARQKEIIEVFYRIAKQEGLENASLAKTAELAGMNPSLIIHYFKSREHLVNGLIEFILDRYLEIFTVPASASGNSKSILLKIIDNVFSKKWNILFDDSVSYSCYALALRSESIGARYRQLLETLRKNLEQHIKICKKEGALDVSNPAVTADLIFVLVDGAYYYLSLVKNDKDYEAGLRRYKKQALTLLNFV
ncbi:TetR family transcriptional regulator [Niabella ginsengisoli]|uniref:Biofilm operon icaADBC HTH-type negative transcriptional regulator IcaR n=1 Tax=Niabella ginsengisoli TaxID=522298 RepID=A0ABS9SE38_9BACT|nr:TetR family transcriptional regulator [Niabella ginsengisoli]MCH5596625.1 TetR family transcriptional regulator [Niabella ginsengisoli]